MKWTLLLAVALSIASAGYGVAQPRLSRFEDFCSLRDRAVVTDTCFGFMSAVIEIINDGHVQRKPEFLRICPPASIKGAVSKIRPWLRKNGNICVGLCDATSYAIVALQAVYPCKKQN